VNFLKYGKIIKNGNVYNFTIYKKTEILNFYNLIYSDANIFLERKKLIFQKHLDNLII
jgi:hypothetical protein